MGNWQVVGVGGEKEFLYTLTVKSAASSTIPSVRKQRDDVSLIYLTFQQQTVMFPDGPC